MEVRYAVKDTPLAGLPDVVAYRILAAAFLVIGQVRPIP